MSLINGLFDTLFNEFCRNNALNSCSFSYYNKKQNYNSICNKGNRDPFTDFSLCCENLIRYFNIALKYEKKRSNTDLKSNEMSMKKALEIRFNANKKRFTDSDYWKDGIENETISVKIVNGLLTSAT